MDKLISKIEHYYAKLKVEYELDKVKISINKLQYGLICLSIVVFCFCYFVYPGRWAVLSETKVGETTKISVYDKIRIDYSHFTNFCEITKSPKSYVKRCDYEPTNDLFAMGFVMFLIYTGFFGVILLGVGFSVLIVLPISLIFKGLRRK